MDLKLLIFIVLLAQFAVCLQQYWSRRARWALSAALLLFPLTWIIGINAVGFLYSTIAVFAMVAMFGYWESKTKGSFFGRSLAAVFGSIVLVCAFVRMARTAIGTDAEIERQERRRVIADARLDHERIRMLAIGRKVGAMFPGARALVIKSPFIDDSTWQIQIDAFKQGSQTKMAVLAVESWIAVAPDGDIDTGIDTTLLSASQFDHFVKQHPDCDTIISFVPLPQKLEGMKFWEIDQEKRPKLILIDVDISPYKVLFEADLVALAMIQKPDSYVDIQNLEQLASPENYLSKYYLSITPQNTSQMNSQHSLF